MCLSMGRIYISVELNKQSRRRNHYDSCQQMVDTIHHHVAANGWMGFDEMESILGPSSFKALMYEMRRHRLPTDGNNFEPTMEWLYHTEYFTRQKYSESREIGSYMVGLFALLVSVLTLLFK